MARKQRRPQRTTPAAPAPSARPRPVAPAGPRPAAATVATGTPLLDEHLEQAYSYVRRDLIRVIVLAIAGLALIVGASLLV